MHGQSSILQEGKESRSHKTRMQAEVSHGEQQSGKSQNEDVVTVSFL